MIIGKTPPQWNKDAAAVLKQFFSSKTGRVALLNWVSMRPALSALTETEAVALQAKYVAGYELAVANLLDLTTPPVETSELAPSTDYPDLDNDELWAPLPQREEAQPPKPEPKKKPEAPAATPPPTNKV